MSFVRGRLFKMNVSSLHCINFFLLLILQIHCYFCWKNVRTSEAHIFPPKISAYLVSSYDVAVIQWITSCHK